MAQEGYRDNLAKELKEIRNSNKEDIVSAHSKARGYHEAKRGTEEYKEARDSSIKRREDERIERDIEENGIEWLKECSERPELVDKLIELTSKMYNYGLVYCEEEQNSGVEFERRNHSHLEDRSKYKLGEINEEIVEGLFKELKETWKNLERNIASNKLWTSHPELFYREYFNLKFFNILGLPRITCLRHPFYFIDYDCMSNRPICSEIRSYQDSEERGARFEKFMQKFLKTPDELEQDKARKNNLEGREEEQEAAIKELEQKLELLKRELAETREELRSLS